MTSKEKKARIKHQLFILNDGPENDAIVELCENYDASVEIFTREVPQDKLSFASLVIINITPSSAETLYRVRDLLENTLEILTLSSDRDDLSSGVLKFLERITQDAQDGILESEVKEISIDDIRAIDNINVDVDDNWELPVSKESGKEAASLYIDLGVELSILEAKRKSVRKDGAMSQRLRTEIDRQSQEMKTPPKAKRIHGLQKKLDTIDSKAWGGTDELCLSVETMRKKQWDILIERASLLSKIMEEFSEFRVDDEMLTTLKSANIEVDEVYSLLGFWKRLDGIAIWLEKNILEEKRAFEVAQKESRIEKPQDEPEKNTTWKYLKDLGTTALKGYNTEEYDAEKRKLDAQVSIQKRRIRQIESEKSAVSSKLITPFWKMYSDVAVLYVEQKKELSEIQKILLRAMLRFGYIGLSVKLLSRAQRDIVLRNSAEYIDNWEQQENTTQIVYADEYLLMISENIISPSYDDMLEINGRETPEWRNERAVRRIIAKRRQIRACQREMEQLEIEQSALKMEIGALLLAKERVKGNNEASIEKREDLHDKGREAKMRNARIVRALERLEKTTIPTYLEDFNSAQEKYNELGLGFDIKAFITRECRGSDSVVGGIRRAVKLTARLREIPSPLSCCKYINENGTGFLSRENLEDAINKIEVADPTIFKVDILGNHSTTMRVSTRISPVILLTPGFGSIGFSWNPADSIDPGRLAVPIYNSRHDFLDRTLPDMLADFRWDTSKAAAGLDWLTSNSLVSGYSAARWSWRKRSLDAREKALVYNEMTDRKNWRWHYKLFLRSSKESAKLLYYKCPNIYDAVVKYVELPKGVEKMKT